MGELQVDINPKEVGFDPERLARIDRHFEAYVDDGRLPGWQLVVSRRGRVAHLSSYGYRDREEKLPIERDTIFRIFSMTKPIVTVAAMMLYEEGAFELKEPIHRYIESFRGQRVYKGGTPLAPITVPATEPIRFWHLMSHTSGLTYGFQYAHPVDAMYRAGGYEWGTPRGADLAAVCDFLAAQPLLFEPGSEWNYGMSVDVLGRLVEVLSGQSLGAFLKTRLFDPLGMSDTAFFAPEHDHDRVAMLYVAGPDRKAVRAEEAGKGAFRRPDAELGGGGLVSTAYDYDRFTRMLLNGGSLDGARILGPRTVAYMAQNHLPGGADLEQVGRSLFAETTFDGVGFGLGFSVVIDAAVGRVLQSEGTYAWGGAASTAFWVDPKEEITAAFFTQLLPSSTHPIRPQLSQLVYQALID